MGSTADWSIPYTEPTDRVAEYPAISQAGAERSDRLFSDAVGGLDWVPPLNDPWIYADEVGTGRIVRLGRTKAMFTGARIQRGPGSPAVSIGVNQSVFFSDVDSIPDELRAAPGTYISSGLMNTSATAFHLAKVFIHPTNRIGWASDRAFTWPAVPANTAPSGNLYLTLPTFVYVLANPGGF